MQAQWVTLVYRLPREPSTPRITLWRKLRRIGVAQVIDGVVALPLDSRNREQLEWLADEVIEAGGDASLWISTPATAAQERALAASLAERIAEEYRTIVRDAEAAFGTGESERRRTLARLRRELRRIGSRDYFPPPEREQARAAVEGLAERVVEVAR
jgi:hypothetical protein